MAEIRAVQADEQILPREQDDDHEADGAQHEQAAALSQDEQAADGDRPGARGREGEGETVTGSAA